MDKYIQYCNNVVSLKDVPNIVYYNFDNILKTNPVEDDIDVSKSEVPDFSDLSLDEYAYPKLPYFTSKGCYWGKCAFCSYRNTKGYKTHSIERILADIKLLKNVYQRRFFQFIDDSVHPSLAKDIATRLIKADVGIKYEAYLRLDKKFDVELCQLLAKSGLRSALFGIESANPRILKIMNKGINLEHAITVLTNMKNAGVRSVVSCIIGFPTETQSEAWDTINYLKKIKDIYAQPFIVHYGLISDMFEYLDEYHIRSINMNNLVRYDNDGFLALGYEYEMDEGMTNNEAMKLISEAQDVLNINTVKDCFFS